MASGNHGGPLSAYSGGLSDNPVYAQAVGDVAIMPTKTVATLPIVQQRGERMERADQGLQYELHDLSRDDVHWRRIDAIDGAMQRHGLRASLA